MFTSGGKSLLLHRSTALSLTSPQKDEWEIPANEVIIEDCLGEGAFGEVYKGIVKCPIINPKVRPSVKNAICTPVAIKLLKGNNNIISMTFLSLLLVASIIILLLYFIVTQYQQKETRDKTFSLR